MYPLRIFFSTALFIISFFLLMQLFIGGFSWLTLVLALSGFIVARYIWPKKSHHDSESARYWWLDMFEVTIELSAEFVMLPIRALGKLID
ncbi:hypothetical protein H0A36_11520 [Endozoicomonas sp. SM1973]|uniref:Uncharacterized protein n=1 Tax=Spartinivicinus marinus TaxID=2994442 RepID=A0A853I7K5_9GAMM|nr:hypothetical protein [Spartinivicinus marinus]MCX4027664.1 hypothetical protein [Spartinivicinus marinus]NYZ66638.1 hypothetical protein [Spartinivicinus marinus]